ncbi:ATP-dependent DNA helicase RecG [Rubripirellula amarantea]|uniref:Probable DNA 3'-5' helicase RecG n=1 Tax=Rubripirellula amarantea TaxID=2527999 RepID=A0A5C5WTX5_9BACT|nr:ATP-dependent DNA helicase RecG [Rubripirellula amarantea]TWT53555.1 ATP-dependent DNA helicase RecG [Rubripirellula amarantea]
MPSSTNDPQTNASSSSTGLSTPLADIGGISRRKLDRLGRLGMKTARDLMFFFPRDYEFPAPPKSVEELREGEPAALVGVITEAEVVSRNAGKSVFGALVENETGTVRILFFNQAFRAEQLTNGRRVMISGTAKLNGFRMEFTHPQVTILGDDDQASSPRILPIYSLTEGLKQIDLRGLIPPLVDQLADSLTEVMPGPLREAAAVRLGEMRIDVGDSLPDIATALRHLHAPPDERGMLAARTRLVFQELLVMQLALAMKRRTLTTELRAPPLPSPAMVDARITNRFPFELTGDQRRTIDEIRADMACQFPMNRMLQGDVGSGKTLVAIYAMMLAVANDHQAVLMAPTEVLARQHFQTLSETLAESRVQIGLLCGSLSAAERRETVAATASGEINLLVGTQALLYGDLEFKRLGLVVIDEQHKFGVAQRVKLRSGGVDPHYLVMSATPIPRSVAMTMFGDVELSTLREKPPGRGQVNTYLGRGEWKSRWWSFVRDRLDEGRQGFIVAPRVTASESADDESEDIASVESVFEELTKEELKDYRVGLLHGRMANDDKQAIMQQFARGDLQVLVSTTVIEVGINVPNATVMTILGAQRFGLAQLHQLRGRVSRGSHTGHVCLFTDGELPPEENERLKTLEETDDGFELAEADFRMRGPGDLLGRRQSGMPPMMIADLTRDVEILTLARMMAQEMIEEDPDLSDPSFAQLKQQIVRRYAKRLSLGDVA